MARLMAIISPEIEQPISEVIESAWGEKKITAKNYFGTDGTDEHGILR